MYGLYGVITMDSTIIQTGENVADFKPNPYRNLDNYNPSYATSWIMSAGAIPEMDYFIQNVTIPSITVDTIIAPYKNYEVKLADNRISFSDLVITFVIDEDFNNYDKMIERFLLNEMASRGKGNDYKEVLNKITLTRLSANNVPIARFHFNDCVLNSLGSITYTSMGSEPDLLVCDASFSVNRMEIERIGKSNCTT